ncbi:PEGA domain-containing protein, partial [Candidatus Saccharibacteria bacterium]|nr:PEGA domain-containing protein [Candidatus Saccharibacteria bacterium]
MDLEERKKRQTLKVLLVEAFMSVAVVVTVVILVLVVSGYSIGSDYKLEQGGLLKVDSEPTGASVILDGEKLGETNFSRVVSSTEHEVVLEKEGYDTWKKKVSVSKG